MPERRVVAAPDKFRGTATASEVAGAMASAAAAADWEARAVPMADGGEGLLGAVGGEARTTTVTGPLGKPVEAEWRLLPDRGASGQVAVVEMARASGLVLAGGAEGNDPEAATTTGTGELVAAAVASGARRVVVGCGGSATTDGGAGAVEALAGTDLSGVELLIACDVTTPFLEAAAVFGPQKGADEATIARLGERLAAIAARYQDERGIDVTAIPGAGAAGGLAGGLAVLGGRIVGGFGLVAGLLGLDEALEGADLVITGEGRLDATSFAGKVVGGVLEHVEGRAPVLVVVGSLAPGARRQLPSWAEVVSLVERYGAERSFADPLPLVTEVVSAHLADGRRA